MVDSSNKENDQGKYELLSKNYKIINKNYICHLNNVIGSGTFGKVLYGTSLDQKHEYAIKFEKSNVKSTVIEQEYLIYKSLQQHEGIPRVSWMGEYKKYKLMIMELLGPSLDKFFTACNKLFSTLTVSLIGDQMVRRLHYVHSKGFVHRDIKPNNFMLGRFSRSMDCINEKIVYIIDFGLSKEYIDPETKLHYPFKDARRFIGTPRYASIGTHLGYKQSRRDDLESIAYILIYFILGELPWQGIKAKSKAEKKEKIKEMKMAVNFAENKKIPKELISLLNYTKNLKYEEKPDYQFIYKLLEKMQSENSIDGYDYIDYQRHVWEWNANFLSVLESKDPNNYKKQLAIYNKLYEGYPVSSFEDFIKKLSVIASNSSNILPTTSSTTSNTNPNTMNYQFKDESNLYGSELVFGSIDAIDKLKLEDSTINAQKSQTSTKNLSIKKMSK